LTIRLIGSEYMNLFPSTDFRHEFAFYTEIAAVVERGTALLLPMIEPGEPVSIKTILNPSNRARVLGLLENLEILDPFSSECPPVNFAIQAAMVNEGVEVTDFLGFSKWHVFSSMGFGSMESRDLWIPMAFQDQESSLLIGLNQAYSRHKLRLAQNPNQSPFASVKKQGVAALAYVMHKVAVSDPKPMADIHGDFADEQVFQVILGMNEFWEPAVDDYSAEVLEQAISKMCECAAGLTTVRSKVDGFFLGVLMPLCISAWLAKGVCASQVAARVRRRVGLCLRIEEYSELHAYWFERVATARLLFSRKQLFRDFIEDPYDVLGPPYQVDEESLGIRLGREKSDSVYAGYSPGQKRLLGIQFAEAGVDLGSEEAMSRVGFQSVSVEMLSAQSIEASTLEERYENYFPDLRIPLWVHDGRRFNMELSDRFLATMIKRMDLSVETRVMLDGRWVSIFVISHSLLEVENDRLPSFVFALDAVGALDAQMLHHLNIDAEFFGLERIAALSPKGRGAFVSQAMGL
jgi:hypothetical protein